MLLIFCVQLSRLVSMSGFEHRANQCRANNIRSAGNSKPKEQRLHTAVPSIKIALKKLFVIISHSQFKVALHQRANSPFLKQYRGVHRSVRP